jgi:DNA-binding transcriptional MerR regulator
MASKQTNHKKLISAKEIMAKYKISYQTINHYTNFGLLSVVLKNGNVRYYNRSLIDKRLRQIRKLIEEGYSLQLIRKKLIGI